MNEQTMSDNSEPNAATVSGADVGDVGKKDAADLAAVFGYEADDSLEAANKKNLAVQMGYHGAALLAALAMWGAADTWSLVSGLAVASVFAVIASIAFGIAMAHIIHEWSHFAGAKWSGAQFTVKEKRHTCTGYV